MTGKSGHCYRPQKKVMFSEASVCVCLRKEGLPPGGSASEGGVSGEGSASGGEEICLRFGGEGICLQEGSAQPPSRY